MLWVLITLNFIHQNEHLREIMILDWQLSRYVSPVIDFCHFMFDCADKAFRDRHYEEFIELYYKTVQAHLTLLNCDRDKLFPKDEFRSHFFKYGKFILNGAMLVLPIMCSGSEKNKKDKPDDADGKARPI